MPNRSFRKMLPHVLWDAMSASLMPYGFKLRKSKGHLVRRSNGRMEVFGLVIIDYPPTFFVRPWAGIRFAVVEKLFHLVSGFNPEYQDATRTVGVDFWRIHGQMGFDIPLQNSADITSVTTRLQTIYHEYAEPFFAQFRTLADVDFALNCEPRQRCVYGGLPHNRCFRGTIIAKLVGRENFNEIVAVYRTFLQTFNNGHFLPSFEMLLEPLRDIHPNGLL
ncbi:MAG: hypothetical protein JSS02_02810 [Planctomycetes bacterium]|nr:hypothetical protein [Planctomycetota bacterium]